MTSSGWPKFCIDLFCEIIFLSDRETKKTTATAPYREDKPGADLNNETRWTVEYDRLSSCYLLTRSETRSETEVGGGPTPVLLVAERPWRFLAM